MAIDQDGNDIIHQLYDLIFVNGDHNIESLRRGDQTWKVRSIEEEC